MKKLLIILFVFFNASVFAQWSIGIKFSGLAFHPKPTNYYTLSFGKKKKLAAYSGVSFICNYQFNPYVGLKLIQTIMPYDCTGNWALVSHFGLNVTDQVFGWKNQSHRGSGTVGPLLYLRKGWLNLKEYKNDPEFITITKHKKWEKKWVWLAGQLQYDYFYHPSRAISLNIFPGYPHVYSFGIGVTNKI